MQELGDSVKYVPSYQLIERIRKEDKAIAKDALKAEKDKVAEEKRVRTQIEQQLTSAVHFLQEKNISVEEIAAILSVSPAEVKKIVRKKAKDSQ
ncbi:hypothetical protein [Leminorella grimontii]|uniref:hypothetical protein n=1 Tax=Leminorella grimontii TaxID=82981 RepID=UPI00207EFF0C|nr:hypothetical protein [Leminorella grimontii]GKX59694.1 hypothetical protein SOASR031_20090 [Leminorella grimontii]